MPRLLITACVALLLACQPESGPRSLEEQVADLQEQAFRDDTAWRLLASLTKDIGPRMAGSEADARAVEWAASRMRELGFDRVWLEQVDFPLWLRNSESGRVLGGASYELDLTALGGTPGTDGALQGEVVHFYSLAELEAAEAGSLAGKIAFVSAGMRRSRGAEEYSETVPQRSLGPFVAAEKGAAALLIRSVGTDTENSAPHTGIVSSSRTGQALPAAALSNASADRLLALLSEGPAVTVELELDVGFRGQGRSHNVIGEFDGCGDGDEFILIGGHLDSWDLGTGAHDDGAGVAITMAAAGIAARQKHRPRRGVRVVLFANEEQGVYGGKAYAAAHADELSRHVLGSESDLGAGRIFEFSTRVNEAAEPEIARLAALLEPLGITRAMDAPASGGADIGQMRELGLPVIDLRHDASLYFDLHHTRNDTLDTVDPADLQFNVAAYVTLLQWAAASDVAFGPIEPSE
jgi:hypothetical protein